MYSALPCGAALMSYNTAIKLSFSWPDNRASKNKQQEHSSRVLKFSRESKVKRIQNNADKELKILANRKQSSVVHESYLITKWLM